MMCQLERAPTTGKLHLQGFIVFEKNKRLNNVCQLLGGHAHVEIMRGRVQDNEVYCGKEETRVAGPWQFGDPPKKGKRTDWERVKTLVSEGKTEIEIYGEAPHLANCARGVDKLRSLFGPKPPLTRDIRVIVLWGAPGTGKTHRARTTYPDAYVITGQYYEGKSFDLYQDQLCLILDEWRCGEWPLTLMNAILDKWQLNLQCRYQNRQANWTTVILCTNGDPLAAYCHDPAFRRRIEGRCIEILDKDNPEINLLTF